ncbi:duf1665 domain containing protein [Colletotrichum scovillei]|uniref:Uncharacterized protein n=1 Tax=Colletotrichum scovillei TaxID=1209932 RepID=A0A9P7QXF9_9PEZI|nr:duf1665 domain containing protein [Colletotrichum scovillei]KAG7052347.1 duf1665 domain containing protein [Colletotrichum scovillei]KAG7064638.1 DUF1665 domain containing protein [Colletotrichum scovillei]
MTELQFNQFSNDELRPQSITHASGMIRLPGYGLPLNYLPDKRDRFPVLMEDTNKSWKASTLLIREVCMLKFMEDITNKPEWWRKVRDPVISARWKEEVQGLDWAAYRSHGDFTKNMAEACMQELRKKAALYEETGLIPVLDYSTCVIKSDKLLPSSLVDRLKVAVKSLEDIPDVEQDWHPGSDGKVLDLVHPSLFPLLYGRSRIMHQRIALDNCLEIGGPEFLVPKPDESDVGEGRTFDWQGAPVELVSTKFQWLPSDVAISEDGRPTIESYVNNLHPREHSDLYPIIEELIQKSLPAWDIIYRWVRKFPVQRLRARKVGKRVAIPDAVPEQGIQLGENESDPTYDGGSWHIEGQLNEHICATALFYYDSANITESQLAFRAPGNREKLDQRLNYQQYDHKSIEKVFAIRSSSDTLQEVGSVLTRPGRALFFSNLSQHKKLREDLMKERTVLSRTVNDELRDVEWSFCEH